MKTMNSAAIFVDVQNVYYTTRQAFGARFDYNAFWAWASERFHIESARAYAIASSDPKQRQFHHILRGIGFDVQLKPFIQRSDGSAKGDWDVGIALDVFEMARDVENVILLSGDGDFEVLVDRVQQRFGSRVTVVGVENLTANHLIDAANEFVAIEEPFLIGSR